MSIYRINLFLMTTIMKRIIAAQNAALDRPSFGVAAMTHSGQSAMVPLFSRSPLMGLPSSCLLSAARMRICPLSWTHWKNILAGLLNFMEFMNQRWNDSNEPCRKLRSTQRTGITGISLWPGETCDLIGTKVSQQEEPLQCIHQGTPRLRLWRNQCGKQRWMYCLWQGVVCPAGWDRSNDQMRSLRHWRRTE